MLKILLAGVSTPILVPSFAFGDAAQPTAPVNFAVPAHACDTHTHVFGDPIRYPFITPRGYTPEAASLKESLAMHRKLDIERIVFVQPSVYGTDNSCMLSALKAAGLGARGIAMVDDKTPASEFDRMYTVGVRGIRANVEDSGLTTSQAAWPVIQAAMERVGNRPGYHLEIHTRMAVIHGLKDKLMKASVPVVIDHFGEANAALGVDQPGFPVLVELVRMGKVYVKLSAPYHISTEGPAYPDVAPLAKALIAANPHRILWGSDWPHPQNVQGPSRTFQYISPLRPIDDGLLLNQFAKWAPDPLLRETILVDNPARIYGY
jgi:predicted TIM-barrel fold metal-dependent hydrolase